MVKRRSTSFDEKAHRMLEIFRKLRVEFSQDNSKRFEQSLRELMSCKMPAKERDYLDTLVENFNFIQFIGQQKFIEEVEKFSLAMKKKKTCVRSDPPTWLTEIEKFRAENRRTFEAISQARDGDAA